MKKFIKLTQHEGTIYEKWSDSNGAIFFVPHYINADNEEKKATWSGGKIPWQTWINICAYFEEVNEIEKSEAQVRLFYNEVKKCFDSYSMPQYKNTGLTTKELSAEESPLIDQIINQMRTNGFYEYGTIHSHCSIGASASGVDEADEKMNEGIHITLGHISKTTPYSVHARFVGSVPGKLDEDGKALSEATFETMAVDWTDFVSLPPFINATKALAQYSLVSLVSTFALRPNTNMADKKVIKTWMDNRVERKCEQYKAAMSTSALSAEEWRKNNYTNTRVGNQHIQTEWDFESCDKKVETTTSNKSRYWHEDPVISVSRALKTFVSNDFFARCEDDTMLDNMIMSPNGKYCFYAPQIKNKISWALQDEASLCTYVGVEKKTGQDGDTTVMEEVDPLTALKNVKTAMTYNGAEGMLSFWDDVIGSINGAKVIAKQNYPLGYEEAVQLVVDVFQTGAEIELLPERHAMDRPCVPPSYLKAVFYNELLMEIESQEAFEAQNTQVERTLA